ncbi:MAG: response regulator transcription factor [Chitinispirillaceae bacterium]|nr:response regulator transcription factor [Chitinispirillaceae bacterium]
MHILLMDDTKKRKKQIIDLLARRHSVVDCCTSNHFIGEVQKGGYDLLMLDMDTWKKGSSIYHYFRIGKLLERLPIVLYNTDDDTPCLPDRARHENDRILPKPFEMESLVEAV